VSVIIIVDLSQVMLSNLMVQLGNHKNAQIEENMVRHMVLNSLRSYRSKFRKEYGELVIACDGKRYWRKEIFPYYKANRKKNREDSELDWKLVFECFEKIRGELKETFPYPVIEIERAEADDVIASLCKRYGGSDEKILILSGDKDFKQLQHHDNVTQYDPVRDRYLVEKNPAAFLREHIISGDTGDGIPNILSNDNCLVIGERQKSVFKKKLEEWLKCSDPTLFCNEIMLRNYKRNEQLIDLHNIPENIYNEVLLSYHDQEGKKAKNLLSYFMAHRLKNLTEMIGDFV
jgi:5'-3' exonuclease